MDKTNHTADDDLHTLVKDMSGADCDDDAYLEELKDTVDEGEKARELL